MGIGPINNAVNMGNAALARLATQPVRLARPEQKPIVLRQELNNRVEERRADRNLPGTQTARILENKEAAKIHNRELAAPIGATPGKKPETLTKAEKESKTGRNDAKRVEVAKANLDLLGEAFKLTGVNGLNELRKMSASEQLNFYKSLERIVDSKIRGPLPANDPLNLIQREVRAEIKSLQAEARKDKGREIGRGLAKPELPNFAQARKALRLAA